MTDPHRPTDPFANLVTLATDQKLFAPEPSVMLEPAQQSTPEIAPSRDISRTKTRGSLRQPSRDHSRETLRMKIRDDSRHTSREPQRDSVLEKSREQSHSHARTLPSRDAIQEFSFLIRDELKVKVQAEVPADWQKELEDMAHGLDVGKLELYRYILGAFLGKVEPDQENASNEP